MPTHSTGQPQGSPGRPGTCGPLAGRGQASPRCSAPLCWSPQGALGKGSSWAHDVGAQNGNWTAPFIPSARRPCAVGSLHACALRPSSPEPDRLAPGSQLHYTCVRFCEITISTLLGWHGNRESSLRLVFIGHRLHAPNEVAGGGGNGGCHPRSLVLSAVPWPALPHAPEEAVTVST